MAQLTKLIWQMYLQMHTQQMWTSLSFFLMHAEFETISYRVRSADSGIELTKFESQHHNVLGFSGGWMLKNLLLLQEMQAWSQG